MKKNILFLIIFLCCLVGVTASLIDTIVYQVPRIAVSKVVASVPNIDPQPVKLDIPAINVDANIESVGLDSLGNMGVPKNTTDVAWFNLGPKPAESGNAVIDGHVDTETGAPAVFAKLKFVQPGDHIYVTDARNITHDFIVEKVQSVPIDPFPTQQIFGSTKNTDLNLITCSGVWDYNAKNYNQRLIVYSRLVE